MERRNGGRQQTFHCDSKLRKLDLSFSIRHSCELEYMLRFKVKAEIEILHEAKAADISDIGSPSIGLPLVRYLAKHINTRLRSSSKQARLQSFELRD